MEQRKRQVKELMALLRQRSSSSYTPEEQISDMISRYGDYLKFTKTFTPEMQFVASENPIRSYIGTAPTLACVAQGYGKNVALAWLTRQLEDINQFSNVHVKLTFEQQKQVAAIFLQHFGYLKVSEMLLFFYKVKQGKYGVFQYSIEPAFFFQAIIYFLKERRNDIEIIRKELHKEEDRLKDLSGEKITYDEYLKRKKDGKNGESI